jgi:hypothetical protein
MVFGPQNGVGCVEIAVCEMVAHSSDLPPLD